MRLKGKIAVITGGGGALGSAIAKKFASEGASLMINDIDEKKARSVAQKIARAGVKVSISVADVKLIEEASRLVEETIDQFGRIDIFVNNAGRSRDAQFPEMSEQDWDFVIDLNLKGCFNCSKHVSRYMIRQKSGKIINISSMSVKGGNIGMANYVAAKSGVIGLTKTLAEELGRHNINVNCVAPGLIDTPRIRKERGISFILQKKEATYLRRIGKPEDVANAVLFLASEESSFITGHVLEVSGGRVG